MIRMRMVDPRRETVIEKHVRLHEVMVRNARIRLWIAVSVLVLGVVNLALTVYQFHLLGMLMTFSGDQGTPPR